ncbi:MAG TPA: hypothetical protein V6C78_02380 [Crinalium sp.]
MSQDQLPPPEPESSQTQPSSQEPIQPSELPRPGNSTDVLQLLRQSWERSLPVVKTQGAALLRKLLQALDWTLVRLEALFEQSQPPSSPDGSPPSAGTSRQSGDRFTGEDDLEDYWDTPSSSPSRKTSAPSHPPPTSANLPDTLADLVAKGRPYVENLQEKASPLIGKIQPVLAKTRPALEKVRPALDTAIEKARPVLNTALEKARPAIVKIQERWPAVLTKIRSVLPVSLNDQLSDRALTGLVAGFLVVLLWVSSGVLSGKPAKVRPTASAPVQTAPTPSPVQPPAPGSSPIVLQPFPSSPPAVPTPPPTLNLTPQQSLISAIQDQVAEVTDRYTEGLIQSIQANFRSSLLTVKLTANWYGLPQEQQDRLADDLLKRSREIDFRKLEITDPQGSLLGRSPVVGTRMVVLKRSEEEEG